jgi:hypothetical protein
MARQPTHFGLRGRFAILVRGAAFGFSEQESEIRFEENTFIRVFLNPKSKIENPKYVHAFFLDLGPNGSG